MTIRKVTTVFIFLLVTLIVNASSDTSIAGFFPLDGSGRDVYSFNPGWRFHRGEAAGAEAIHFNDSHWEAANLPHTVQLMPAEGSGNRNYQGVAWYRKRFVAPPQTKGKQLHLHFEGIMGKQELYVNGQHVRTHTGGYLPFTINLTSHGVQAGDTCLIAVMTDNSDDKSFPPGKPQYTLDFAYHGGIYRDAWLIAKAPVSITDAVEADRMAGGGVFVHYGEITANRAEVYIDTDVQNDDTQTRTVTVETILYAPNGSRAGRTTSSVTLKPGEWKQVKQQIGVKNPELWSPHAPHLYKVHSLIKQRNQHLDGGITRIGIRKAEFRGSEGFWLNGRPYGQLIGANRHQDFAYVGNAMPNSQHRNDAKLLRQAGCTIIRVAHYPQDPSFMDACDELGMFVIVATPGWQYWNKDPKFGELVHINTTQMIRRDRNHPCVLMWEPILNETRFPLDFALRALEICREEFPYPGAPVVAADMHSAGVSENYDVVYGWPGDDEKGLVSQPIFTREFGENVDDWYAHNNNNRASRSWGERAQLVQALSLAKSYNELFRTNGQFIGGAHWHPIDHQRGYHPDPYWGGMADAFRQPKYAYYMFRSQTEARATHPLVEMGPMVYIAHEMSPFSDKEMVVFSNCDSVRLTVYDGDKSVTMPVLNNPQCMPSEPLIFPCVWDFWEARELSYKQKNWQKVNVVAEGFVDGQVACSTKRMPSRRSTKLQLRLQNEEQQLMADGSDFQVVIAEVTDDSGNVRRLAKENVVFTVEGEGEIIGDASILANPRTVEFGSAPVLIRSTLKPGKIKVTARVQFEGTHAPTAAELNFESVAPGLTAIYLESETNSSIATHQSLSGEDVSTPMLSEEEKRLLLIEVEKQQTEFGTGK